ncbi:hypothetical protein NC651_003116 [Populus alba x Populus x berolinensis]|nr:hypothetical protein NC651_003116 [Populus alba x Populus x berolinensis]
MTGVKNGLMTGVKTGLIVAAFWLPVG